MKHLIANTLLALAATSIPCAAQISGGNPAVSAPNTDSYYNFTIVDQNNPISGTGDLNYWQVYASTSGEVQLLIVQPSTNDIVAESTVESVVPGLNTFTLSTPISGVAGDYVGFWEGPNNSSVEFSFTGGTIDYTNDNSGSPTSPLTFAGTSNRTYSIFVSSPEGGTGFEYLLFAGAACLGAAAFTSHKRKTSASNA